MEFLITAGPTREAIDPVRYLSNHSSGRMGFAIAKAARAAGHDVLLIAGPVHLETPSGVKRINVESASEMYATVRDNLSGVDVAIMTAAVSDYTPEIVAEQKIKKESRDHLVLRLVSTPDILGSMRKPLGFCGYLVGFAAETNNCEENALSKLKRKNCDMLVLNDVSQSGIGFGSADNQVSVFYSDNRVEELKKQPKTSIATKLVRFIEQDRKNATR